MYFFPYTLIPTTRRLVLTNTQTHTHALKHSNSCYSNLKFTYKHIHIHTYTHTHAYLQTWRQSNIHTHSNIIHPRVTVHRLNMHTTHTHTSTQQLKHTCTNTSFVQIHTILTVMECAERLRLGLGERQLPPFVQRRRVT
jgi:hypothetical protein